jgi:anti-anti-sigma regulatory factor
MPAHVDELIATIEKAIGRVDEVESELVLDFSPVQRLDPSAVTLLEKLAGKAQEKGVKVLLEGVSVEVYRVLKLAKLAQRFSFRG